jgi:hypothetical protein
MDLIWALTEKLKEYLLGVHFEVYTRLCNLKTAKLGALVMAAGTV